MTTKREAGTYHGTRAGPPGDETVYWMPRDFAAWEKAWDVHAEPLSVTRRGQGEADMSPEAVAARAEAKRRQAEAMRYVAQYTGTWGLPLDIRANPRWGTKHMKLSERQVEVLLAGRDRDLERIEQARINTELWQDEEYRRVSQRTEAPQGPQLAPQPSPAPAMAGDVADGWYMVDGQPWKVQWNRERTRKYAKRLVSRDRRGDRDAGPDLGAKPEWEYVPGGLRHRRPQEHAHDHRRRRSVREALRRLCCLRSHPHLRGINRAGHRPHLLREDHSMTRTAITYRLSVSTDGSAARVDVTGPRYGMRWVGEFTEAQLREYALVFEAQADMLHDPKWPSIRCVCVSREHEPLGEKGRIGRCAGTGNKDRNSGYCIGCRTPERGIYGVGQPGKHIPMGAGAWPVEWGG